MTAPEGTSPTRPAGGTFCILPFIQLSLQPDGAVKPCGKAACVVERDGRPLTVHDAPLEVIWHSDHLRQLRAAVLADRPARDCTGCYAVERAGGQSLRQASNARWLERLGTTPAKLKARRKPAAPLADAPLSWQLMPGNACNLKCRMCTPLHSSRVAADPVQSRWAATLFPGHLSLDWQANPVPVAPVPLDGVQAEGVHGLEPYLGETLQWTDGAARWALDVPVGKAVQALRLRLWDAVKPGQEVTVEVRGTRVTQGRVPSGTTAFKLPLGGETGTLTIACDSEARTVEGDARRLGVPLRDLALDWLPATGMGSAATAAHSARVATRPWHGDTIWLAGQLLGARAGLRAFEFNGGEPLLGPLIPDVLDPLIAGGRAPDIELDITSNGTLVNDDVTQRLRKFRQVRFALSIDAVGPLNDYIRHPSRWPEVEATLQRLHALAGPTFQVAVVTVVQAYNVLKLADLLRFLDRYAIRCTLELASQPALLQVAVLPTKVRRLALARLDGYAREAPAWHRQAVQVLAAGIAALTDQSSPAALQAFRSYTDELDAARGERFEAACPELHALLSAPRLCAAA